jgi:hypothetical protein
MRSRRFHLFEDVALQAEFVSQVRGAGIAPQLNPEGAVDFGADQADAVMTAVHRIRDRHFRWYLIRCQNPKQTAEFREFLEREKLLFVVEHSESGTWFVVPNGDRERHEQLFARLTA